MRRKILSTVCTLIIMVSMMTINLTNVNAANNEKIDGSSLTTEESSRGTTSSNIMTRGEHLMDGECSITKAGRGRIYVYAATTANHEVDYVSTIIYVDRYNETTKDWGQIDSWQVEDLDTYYVSTNKTITVERGYYYRVHADHVAGMKAQQPYDEATSFTDGIWID